MLRHLGEALVQWKPLDSLAKRASSGAGEVLDLSACPERMVGYGSLLPGALEMHRMQPTGAQRWR